LRARAPRSGGRRLTRGVDRRARLQYNGSIIGLFWYYRFILACGSAAAFLKGWFSHLVKQILLTKEGLEKMEAELDELKGVKRKEVAEKIKVALSFGDLSENSEYDEAKNEQAIVEARIADIEAMLKNVKVLDESELSSENIHMGSKVELRVVNPKTGSSQVVNYKIVGSNEADPLNGCISDESAVGKALLNRAIGDKVEVEVPAGKMEYEVLTISK
jgi:transcription elongation factor GreA